MSGWVIPSIAYVLALGALGITIKIALKTCSWQVLIVCAAVAYVVASIGLMASGSSMDLEQSVSWAIVAGALAVGGLVAFNIALKRGPASVVVPITASYPLTGALMAATILSEKVTVGRAIGMLVIVAGVVILSSGSSETP